MMKFAICNETFLDWPMERAAAFAAECGYTGFELAPFTLGPSVSAISAGERKKLRETITRAGLEVIGLHWLLAKTTGLHVTSRDEATRRRTTEYLIELVRLCSDLGGTLMVFGSPGQRNLVEGMSSEEGRELAARTFEPVLPVLEKHGVTLALEPLGPAEGNFLLTAAETMELARRLDSPRVRLHLDCKAMSSESHPIPDLIRRYRAEMAHFHANDPNRRGPGMGELDFAPILKALHEIEYDGWVSVEVFDYEPGPERLARESIENLRLALARLPERVVAVQDASWM
jgi:sugar phosphate isomerase/epimerase